MIVLIVDILTSCTLFPTARLAVSRPPKSQPSLANHMRSSPQISLYHDLETLLKDFPLYRGSATNAIVYLAHVV